MSTACYAATFEGSGCRGTITDGQCSEQDDHHPTPGMLPYDGPGAESAGAVQAHEPGEVEIAPLEDYSTWRQVYPDTGPPPLDFDLLVRSIVDSRYMWISMENAVDMAVTTARLLVDAGAVRIVADGQPVEVHGSLSAMRRLVHSRGITADERDHDVAVSRPVPPLEGRERDRLREVVDAAGLPRDRDWDDVLLALRSMGARAVPKTGQARPVLNAGRRIVHMTSGWQGEYVKRDSADPRAVLVKLDRDGKVQPVLAQFVLVLDEHGASVGTADEWLVTDTAPEGKR